MNSNISDKEICTVIEQALINSSSTDSLSEPITIESKMGAPLEWDSLSFVSVFQAISEHFDIEVDDDDAILFRDVRSIHNLINEIIVK